nr:VacJ family lipoprotein [uncultured Desulfobacter sp.]
MKFYPVLFIVMALVLVTGPAVAGNAVGQSGHMTSSSRSDSPDESVGSVQGVVDSVEGDAFDADIFQADQGQSDQAMVADPFEGLNRAVFFFNDKLYMYGLRPISKGYAKVVPTFARRGVKNFFTNLLFPIRFVNALLQGKGEAAGREFSAFFINTTLGFGGLNNFAQKYVGIRLEDEDFGQTLGSYGIGSGIYLVLPVLGPSSFRDAVGRAGDWLINPINYAQPWELSWGAWGLEKVSWTSFHIGEYEAFKDASIDPYAAMRNAYLQNRQALVDDVAGAQKLKNSKE